MTTLAIDRDVALETAYNVRHLGGYPTATGRNTTATDLLRGATLHELTERGCEALRAYGVRTVVDLRSEVEHETCPTPDLSAHAITVIEAPVFQADASSGALAKNEGYPGHAVVYRSFLADGGAAYRTLFEGITSLTCQARRAGPLPGFTVSHEGGVDAPRHWHGGSPYEPELRGGQ